MSFSRAGVCHVPEKTCEVDDQELAGVGWQELAGVGRLVTTSGGWEKYIEPP
jgi:hypothetical protein